METHCIDVFFAFRQYPIHIVTAGSIIPDELNDIMRNRTLQEETERNKDSAVSISLSTNKSYIISLLDRHRSIIEECRRITQFQESNESYPQPEANQIPDHFLFYAKRGFYSYDCCKVKEDGTAIYRLMAWPEKTQKMNYDLPQFTPKGLKENKILHLPEYIEL